MMVFIKVECVRRITWNVHHARPTAFSFGWMFRLHTLCLLKGVPHSEGNTNSYALLDGLIFFHSRRPLTKPSVKAAWRTDLSVFGVSRTPS